MDDARGPFKKVWLQAPHGTQCQSFIAPDLQVHSKANMNVGNSLQSRYKTFNLLEGRTAASGQQHAGMVGHKGGRRGV